MRKHMLGLLVLLGAGVAVWADGPLDQLKPGDLIVLEKSEKLKPGEVIIHDKRPGDVIIEGVPGEKVRITFQIPGRERRDIVVKPLPNGRLLVTHDEEVPIDRHSQGVTLFLKKAAR